MVVHDRIDLHMRARFMGLISRLEVVFVLVFNGSDGGDGIIYRRCGWG